MHFSLSKSLASLLGGLSLLVAGAVVVPGSAQAQEGDMFPSKAAAQQRAKELRCSGVFQMGSQWMPCQNFSAYERAVQHDH